jgi:hypothetical protein
LSITQLVYYSRHKPASPEQSNLAMLRDVLAASQRNNPRDALTGFLLFDAPWFTQVLEGEHDRVVGAYNRIQRDARHDGVVLMALREAPERSFPRWSMAGAMRNLDQQEIFLRHGVSAGLVPSKLTAATFLALAVDLQDFAIGRSEAVRAVS